MPALKRSYDVANGADDHVAPLHRVRNMWQFANLVQWIYIFGKAAKIDENIDVEIIEDETLKQSSTILQDVALALVKMASSFRGIASDGLDDQLRKLYRAHAPDSNPFGEEDEPLPFEALDSLTKIRVLQQLTQWVMIHPERFRDKMDEQKDSDQTSWRIEPYGWDSEDRTYFVLDDNRLYRLTEPPPPPPPAKKAKKMKTYRSGRRSSRRQREPAASMDDEADDSLLNDDANETHVQAAAPAGDDTLGGMVWECIAVTLGEVQAFLDSIARTRDDNEKVLRNQVRDHLLPILQKQEESRKRRQQQRERELLNQAKMATAKRSSRIASKIEQQKHDEETKKHEEHTRIIEAAERREERERMKRERERDFRMASREDRLKERETRRRLHEEELAQLSEDSRNMSERSGRVSERRLQADIERNQQALKELEEEEDDWIFDCTCGLYGRIDDGEHSIACEKCNIWQHSKCTGISEKEAEREDFHFICPRCIKREQEGSPKTRPTIKLKLHNSGSRPSSSAGEAKSAVVVAIPARPHDSESKSEFITNGHPVDKQSVGGSTRTNGAATDGPLEYIGGPSASTSTRIVPSAADQEHSHVEGHLAPAAKSDQSQVTREVNLSPGGSGANTQMPLNITTPLQDRQNGDRPNGIASVQLLATPSLGGAAHPVIENDNGLHSSPGGLSPTKLSPQVATGVSMGDAARPAKLTLSPMTSLAPAPSPQDPTPPVKSFDAKSSFTSSES